MAQAGRTAGRGAGRQPGEWQMAHQGRTTFRQIDGN
jgi:hypothetical protein